MSEPVPQSGAAIVPAQQAEEAAAAPPAAPSAAVVAATSAVVAAPAPSSDCPSTVYDLIHALYAAVVDAIDQPLAWDALLAPSVGYTVIKPIVEKFSPKPAKEDMPEDASNSLGAVLFALMANR
jgi:hypothetical protein